MSNLNRFGINPHAPPDDDQWQRVTKLLEALLNNPSLQVGDRQSQSVIPEAGLSGAGGGGRLPTKANRRRFQPYGIRPDDAVWVFNIEEGFVLDSHVQNEAAAGAPHGVPAASAVMLRVPRYKVGDDYVQISNYGLTGDDLTNWVRPTLGIPTVASYIYLHFYTNEHGNIIEVYDEEDEDDNRPLEILVSSAEIDSVHHEPEDEDGANGVEGNYYWQIAKTESNGETTPGPSFVHAGHQGDFNWQEAFTVQNIGTGSDVYKQFNNVADHIELRRILGDYGINNSENGDTIELDFEGDSLGTGEPVYLEPGHADKINAALAEFRGLAGGDTPRDQVEVFRKDGSTIGVRGNNKFGTLRFEDYYGNTLYELSWADGLITSGAAFGAGGGATITAL